MALHCRHVPHAGSAAHALWCRLHRLRARSQSISCCSTPSSSAREVRAGCTSGCPRVGALVPTHTTQTCGTQRPVQQAVRPPQPSRASEASGSRRYGSIHSSATGLRRCASGVRRRVPPPRGPTAPRKALARPCPSVAQPTPAAATPRLDSAARAQSRAGRGAHWGALARTEHRACLCSDVLGFRHRPCQCVPGTLRALCGLVLLIGAVVRAPFLCKVPHCRGPRAAALVLLAANECSRPYVRERAGAARTHSASRRLRR